MMLKTVVERIVDSDLRSSLKYCSNTIQLSPVNTPGKLDPHEYSLQFFCKNFLDAFIAETNLLVEEFFRKVILEVVVMRNS